MVAPPGVAEVEGEGLVLFVDFVFVGGHGQSPSPGANVRVPEVAVVGAFLGGTTRGP